MDYEFQRDLTGGILARFSMDHEAIGYWLNDVRSKVISA